MSYCEKCGAKNIPEAKFCGCCGSKLYSGNNSIKDINSYSNLQQPQLDNTVAKTNKKKVVIIVLASAVLLLAIITSVILFVQTLDFSTVIKPSTEEKLEASYYIEEDKFFEGEVFLNPEDEYLYTVYEDYVEINMYIGKETELIIPSELQGLPVTIIKCKKLPFYDNIVSIYIPETVQEISVETATRSSSDFTIYCEKNSFAERYAKRIGYSYDYIE